jgi:ATP-binding cassette subfamily B protein
LKSKGSKKKLSDYYLFIIRAVKLVWQCTPVLTVLNIVIVLFQAVIPLASLFIMKKIVDSVSEGISAAGKLSEFDTVLFWLLLAAAVAVLSAILASVSSYISEAQSLRVTDFIVEMLHKRSVIVDLEFYEDPKYFNTLRRAQKDAPHRPTMIVRKLVEIIKNSLSLTGIGVLLFSFNWWLGLFLMVVALPSAIVKIKFSRTMFGYQQKHTEMERKSWYFHMLMTDRNFAQEVRLFNLGEYFVFKFKNLITILRENKLAISRRRAVYELSTQVLTTTAIFGTFAFICYQTLGGIITLGGMVMYYQGFQRGLNFLKSLLGNLAGLYEDNLFLSNFYKFLDLKPKIKTPEDPVAAPKKGDIKLRDITFTYPGNETAVLSGLNLSISQGKVVALVGENGAGKSTLVKLICRFYDPESGDICFNGINLKKMDPVKWRKKISVIFQDFIKYNLTAEENIRVGDVNKAGDRRQETGDRSQETGDRRKETGDRSQEIEDRGKPEALITKSELDFKRQDEIMKAAKRSGADPVLKKLPKGYNSQLGRMFAEGQELSAGEWQKVAIARAFYRDSDIIILDEPSSSLDPLSEAELFEQFKKLIKGKTAILISHRFSTVKMADEIFVMKDKKIIEQGSHAELIVKKGFYYRMYYAQAKNYEKC